MRLHCPYSKECHCHKVTKATPDLSPSGTECTTNKYALAEAHPVVYF
jgi:hypothetical protein